MSPQADYVVSNGTGAAVRSDINGQLAAIVSNNSGASAPATTYAYMLWADTSTNLLKLRNGANSAWITVGDLTAANLGLAALASPTFTGTATIPTLTVSTAANIPLGSAASPTLYFTGDSNTGLYSPGADQVALSTGGTGRLFIDSSGRCGIGTSSPSSTAGGVDISSGGIGLVVGADGSVSTRTNATDKIFRIGSAHYTNAEEPVCIAFGQNLSADNELNFGGGSAALNAATYIRFFTAANNTTTSGTERMRITSAGNVGIGSASPVVPFVVSNAGAAGIELYHGSGFEGIQAYNRSTSAYTDLLLGGANLRLANATGEAARIDSSGRLLVGTSSAPSAGDGQYGKVVIQGYTGDNTAQAYLSLQRGQAAASIASGAEIGALGFNSSEGYSFAGIKAFADATTGANDYPGRLVFSTTADGASSPTERMRISNNGATSIFGGANNQLVSRHSAAAGTSSNCFVAAHSATNNTDGTASLVIRTNGNVENTNNSYGALSDVKLKENIVDAASQWDDIKALQVRKYNFKEGQTHTQIGLIAQEVELVSPGLVTESPDRDAEGNDLGTVTKSVNYSVLYMKAVKALQEAMERIEQLESEMAEVKAQLS